MYTNNPKKTTNRKTTETLDRSNNKDLEGIRETEKFKDMEDKNRWRTLIEGKKYLNGLWSKIKINK